MAAVVEVDLRAVDRLQPEALGRLRELHRAAQPVVVGQREGSVAQLGSRAGQLVRQRGAGEEGEGGVGVELGVYLANRCSHRSRTEKRGAIRSSDKAKGRRGAGPSGSFRLCLECRQRLLRRPLSSTSISSRRTSSDTVSSSNSTSLSRRTRSFGTARFSTTGSSS